MGPGAYSIGNDGDEIDDTVRRVTSARRASMATRSTAARRATMATRSTAARRATMATRSTTAVYRMVI